MHEAPPARARRAPGVMVEARGEAIHRAALLVGQVHGAEALHAHAEIGRAEARGRRSRERGAGEVHAGERLTHLRGGVGGDARLTEHLALHPGEDGGRLARVPGDERARVGGERQRRRRDHAPRREVREQPRVAGGAGRRLLLVHAQKGPPAPAQGELDVGVDAAREDGPRRDDVEAVERAQAARVVGADRGQEGHAPRLTALPREGEGEGESSPTQKSRARRR